MDIPPCHCHRKDTKYCIRLGLLSDLLLLLSVHTFLHQVHISNILYQVLSVTESTCHCRRHSSPDSEKTSPAGIPVLPLGHIHTKTLHSTYIFQLHKGSVPSTPTIANMPLSSKSSSSHYTPGAHKSSLLSPPKVPKPSSVISGSTSAPTQPQLLCPANVRNVASSSTRYSSGSSMAGSSYRPKSYTSKPVVVHKPSGSSGDGPRPKGSSDKHWT